MPGPPGSIASLTHSEQSQAAPVSLNQLERTGQRMSLLQRHAPQLVLSTTPGALALAESNLPDDAMISSATEAVNYANVQQLYDQLNQESDETANALWASTPVPLQKALAGMGYKPPAHKPPKKGNRWGINLPDFLPGPDELTISRDTPIVGPLGNVQAGLGEGLQAVAGAGGTALGALQWIGDQPAHLYRSWRYIEDAQRQQGMGLGERVSHLPDFFAASNFSKAWHATDEDDGYVRPAYRERARKALGGDEQTYRLAHYTAMKLDPAEILDREGVQPGTPEANQLLTDYQSIVGTDEFKTAVHQLSIGQASPGRVFTQSFGLDDTDHGWGKAVSGALDAAFIVTADPTLIAGKFTKGYRLGRAAFMLEDAGDVARGLRMADIGELALKSREGLDAAEIASKLGRVQPWDMYRGRQVVRWADRVARGFSDGKFASLMRDVPNITPALSAMSDYHAAAAANGVRDLTTAQGVLDWLRSEEGILKVAGSRLGGGSPLVEGLRIPSLTLRDRAMLRTKGIWTDVIDWGRMQTDPFHGARWNDYFKNVLGHLGNPADLTRQFGRWALAHTAGDSSRVIAALTAHTPYEKTLPLFGDEAVGEFSRLVNTGIFSGFTRSMMDDYIDNFIKHPEITNRSTQVEQFLKELFDLGGVTDGDFYQRFVGRYRQAYAIDGGDVLHVNGIETRAARLVDAQHADALAIPDVKQFLGESYRANWLRAMFHNPGSSWVDTRLGRAWKPSVLMRLGFIPRAAGEELFHFVLKHGPRTYLGAKGAEWMVAEEHGNQLRSLLKEALDLGQTDKANRIEQQLAETVGALPPVRALMAGSDRMFARLFESSVEGAAPWRRNLASKAEAFDPHGPRGVVTGLERWANQWSIRASDAFDEITKLPYMPSKGKLGEYMAKWNPEAATAARDMIEHPWVMRAWAEQVSGASLSPFEFRNVTVLDGVPVAKVRIGEIRGGIPVVQEVPLREVPGSYETINRVATQDQSFYDSLYARHNWVRHDRVGNTVLGNVLPRWVGGEPYGKLPRKLGYGAGSLVDLRRDLNKAWAHVGGDIDGNSVLWHLRRYIDGTEPDAGKGWLGAQMKKLFAEADTSLGAGKFLTLLDDPKFSSAAKRWLLYEDVDPERLIDDFPTLVSKMRNVAKVRLARPDMYHHLSESRLYAHGGPGLATPIARGMHKVYVPLMPADYEAVGLGEDFVRLATQRITRIGGYDPETAEQIARRVAAGAMHPSVPEMSLQPLANWAANDPRIADAVMASAEQVTGHKPVFGVLSVPDEVVQTSAGQFPQGLVTEADGWQLANDFTVEPFRMIHTEPTEQSRRFVKLEVGDDWWDDAQLDAARQAFENKPAGTTRWFSTDGVNYSRTKPYGGSAATATESPFWFVDHPGRAKPAVDDLLGAHKMPGVPGPTGFNVTARQVSPGLGEAEALENVAHSTVDELLETLTTAHRDDIDPDVLHEVVEPLLRPDRTMVNAAGNKEREPGYTYEHLVGGTKVDRLPLATYGPEEVGARDLRWSKFVQEFFSGPVNRAISSVIRKPMFLHIYGQQLRNTRVVADLFVAPEVREAALRAAGELGLPEEALDDLAINAQHVKSNADLADLVRTMAGDDHLDPTDEQLGFLRYFEKQRNHGLDLARENALNRTFQLITPFIDDHRVRSAFQNYVGNFIPFLFAEEQFLKRWARSVAESPEMVRKAQIGLNGLRAMGTVRKDSQGNEMFVYPGAGAVTELFANTVPDVFGVDIRLPYAVEMTGQVGYTLPGLGQQMGTPSVGPLVGMGVEFLSRHYPELADVEDDVLGRGANRPLWQYIVPTSAGNLWQAAFGDMDKGQLASLNLQAIQNMALAGQLPPEDASPEEREHFLEQVRGQVRFLALSRAVFGMNAPASPQISMPSEELSDEFQKLLQADMPMEDAVLAFIKRHPDIQPTDLLSVTTSKTESEFSGLDLPTDKAFKWMQEHEGLVKDNPAAAAWLIPRADDKDSFSFRAWNQQLAVGLRKRKAPDDFLNDIYFQAAARDYFDAREFQESRMLTATGDQRAQFTSEWSTWKSAYFHQHPVFEHMLSDTTRQQRRREALDQLTVLSADPEGPVPDDMREMVQRYDEYKQTVSLLRGDRRGAVVNERRRLTEELRAWMLWHIERNPDLAPLYMRTIEPELGESDEDAASTTTLAPN